MKLTAMDPDNEDTLTQETMQNCIVGSTRKMYDRYATKFLSYLATSCPAVVDGSNGEVSLNLVTSKQIFMWLASERVEANPSTGKRRGIATLRVMRAAVAHVFRERDVRLPEEYIVKSKTYFAGAARMHAKEKQAGVADIIDGHTKDRLPFGAYRAVSQQLMKDCSSGLHLLMLLAWNTIGRLDNVGKIRMNHMFWAGDCFTVTFATTKTDQEGISTTDPKHVYANVLDPWICPLLSLAVHLSTSTDHKVVAGSASASGAEEYTTNPSPPLFPGGHQANRFIGHLKMAVSSGLAKQVLDDLGINVEDIAGL